MKNNHSPERRYRRCLLIVLLVIILIMQASAVSDLQLDLSVSPPNALLIQPVTIYAHVYDPANPAIQFSHANVGVWVTSNTNVSDNLGGTTNSSGWAAISYTPPVGGRYFFYGTTSVNYNTIPGLPHAGIQSATAEPASLTVTSLAPIPFTQIKQIVIVTSAATTAPPVTTPLTTQQTTLATPVTPVTPVTQVTPATSPTPGSQSDIIPPVTTLTLAGTQDGSGGYSSDVTCTLAAADNAGGSGMSLTQYSFDSSTWYTYSRPVSIIQTGQTILYYRSADNAGNTEQAKVKAIVISGPGATPAGTPAPATSPAQTATGSLLQLWPFAVILLFIAAIAVALYLTLRPGKEEPKT